MYDSGRGCHYECVAEENQMVANAKEVGDRRYRESYGRYLEDFKEGDIYEHSGP